MWFTMRNKSRALLSVSAIALSAVALTACGGSDEVEPVAEVPKLTGESTAVTLDAGFASALESLKLTPGVVGDATLDGGAVSFPITGGNVTYFKPGSISPYVTGEIKHDGSGLSLTSGDTVVELTDFNIDPANSRLYGDVSVNGKSAAKDVMVFKLNGSTLKPLQTGPNDTAILEGTTVHVSEVAAGLLNDTFKTDAVEKGLLVGVAKITINTK